jgi:hypothetical protein
VDSRSKISVVQILEIEKCHSLVKHNKHTSDSKHKFHSLDSKSVRFRATLHLQSNEKWHTFFNIA